MNEMSTGDVLAVLLVLLLIVGSIPAACWQIRRARRTESVHDEIVRLAHERAERARTADQTALDPGPVEEQVSLVLHSHLLDNPYLGDQFARLDRAIREQQHGDNL